MWRYIDDAKTYISIILKIAQKSFIFAPPEAQTTSLFLKAKKALAMPLLPLPLFPLPLPLLPLCPRCRENPFKSG